MSAPKPGAPAKPKDVERDADSIILLAKSMAFDYGYFYDSAYELKRGSRDVASRQRHGDHTDLSDRFVEKDESGPGALTTFVQDCLAMIAKDVNQALELLLACEARRRAIENRLTPEPKAVERDESVIERPADTGDLKRAREAKARREADPRRLGEVR